MKFSIFSQKYARIFGCLGRYRPSAISRWTERGFWPFLRRAIPDNSRNSCSLSHGSPTCSVRSVSKRAPIFGKHAFAWARPAGAWLLLGAALGLLRPLDAQQQQEPAFSWVQPGGQLQLHPNYAFDAAQFVSLNSVIHTGSWPAASAQAQVDGAIAALGSAQGIVVEDVGGSRAVPTAVPANVMFVNLAGSSTASPGGEQITFGCVPEQLPNNTGINLKQCSISPGATPQNALYVEQLVTGALAGNTQNTNWAIFCAAQVQDVTSVSAGEEEDCGEFEASAQGTGDTPNLVGIGAQDPIYNFAGDTETVPQADSMYARAPFLAGSGGSASTPYAVSLRVDTPEIGTQQNVGIFNSSLDATHPAIDELGTAGNPVWSWLTNNYATRTDDLSIQATNSPTCGSDIYLSHGGPYLGTSTNAPLYLTACGSGGAVIINGEPTHPNFGATTNGAAGLWVYPGGSSASLPPMAASGTIRMPAQNYITERNNENSADCTIIGLDSSDNVWIDPNGCGLVVGQNKQALPSTVKYEATALTANVASGTVIIASPAAGLYRITCSEEITTAATSSSQLPYVYIDFTLESGSSESVPCTTESSANTVGTFSNNYNGGGQGGGQFDIHAGDAIETHTANYASSGATAMQYSVHIVVTGPY